VYSKKLNNYLKGELAMANRKHHVVPLADAALDKFKHEVATELGLEDDIQTKGWANMTSRECGLVGGNMVRQMIGYAENALQENSQKGKS
jgi:hypothetical protein